MKHTRMLAAGVAYPDLLIREGVHPEKPPLPFTPGWDLVGVVDRLGDRVEGMHELLGKGGVTGMLALVGNGSALESGGV